MELPHLGQHCSEISCKRLDFLPMKCDACKEIFCSEHFSYIKHNCSSAYKKDIQVPVCPLCGEPVPTANNVSPDLTVGRHIDEACRSEKKKIFTNKCSYQGCKKKELIPFKCNECKVNFCLRHRHTVDHDCKGPIEERNIHAAAAIARQKMQSNNVSTTANRNNNYANHVQNVQGGMSEDEALAHALALSLQEQEKEQSRQPPRSNQQSVPCGGSNTSKDKCSLS